MQREYADLVPGDADGYGVHGELTVVGERVLCHECGGHYQNLGAHAWGAHRMRAADYRARHGLGRATALVGPAVTAKLSAAASRTDRLARLAAVRDPDRARAAMTGTIAAQTRAGRAARAAAAARRPSEEQLARLGDPEIDRPSWTARAAAMVETEGLSKAGISAAYGRSPAWLAARIRRYRPDRPA